MLTLDQLILAATALPDADKAILIDRIAQSMAEPIDANISIEDINKAQARLAEIDRGEVQTIPGDVALAQVRQMFGQ